MKILLFTLLLLFSGSTLAGQLSSDFSGAVVDAQGKPVVGAVMVVENLTTGRVSKHTTGETGRWHAQGRRSDSAYRISCYAPGAATPQVQFEGKVQLGKTHRRNCVIGQLGATSPKWLFSWSWRQAQGNRYVVAR